MRGSCAPPTPFLDLRLLGGNLPLLATYARSLLAAITSYALLYGFTQWLEEGRGLSPQVAGLVLLPVFAAGIVVSSITGRSPRDPRQAAGRRASRRSSLAVLLLFVDAQSAALVRCSPSPCSPASRRA